VSGVYLKKWEWIYSSILWEKVITLKNKRPIIMNDMRNILYLSKIAHFHIYFSLQLKWAWKQIEVNSAKRRYSRQYPYYQQNVREDLNLNNELEWEKSIINQFLLKASQFLHKSNSNNVIFWENPWEILSKELRNILPN